MADEPLPDAEVETYFFDSFVPTDEALTDFAATVSDGLGMYLLDLMRMQGYRVVSGVRFTLPEPETAVEYPDGLAVLRAEVDVQEVDVTV